MKQVRATIRIRGLVQGVNFRNFTTRKAQDHSVTGWVRNLPNGEVEAVLEGRDFDVKKVIESCQEGPGGSRVDEVLIDREDYRGEFNSFKTVY
ncbi:MAG: acylphosphatase [Desulfuromonadales bacterium]